MTPRRDWSPEVAVLIDYLATYYLDSAIAERVGSHLRRHLEDGAYSEITDDAEFAEAVSAETVEVSGDRHLQLRFSVAPLPERTDPLVADSGRDPREAAAAGHGFAKVERLAGNVGFVDIRRFFPTSLSRPQAVSVMNLVADADALIIDLRNSMGGEPDMVALLCSYLFDDRVHLNNLYFPAEDTTIEWWTEWPVPGPRFGGAKTVFVLISGRTISAAEEFAYDLQQLERATLVGETTAGAANFDYRYRVNEHLMFSVPSGYPVNPISGRGWEGTGIEPDLKVPAGLAFDAAYRQALEHVLTLDASGYRSRVVAEAREAIARLAP